MAARETHKDAKEQQRTEDFHIALIIAAVVLGLVLAGVIFMGCMKGYEWCYADKKADTATLGEDTALLLHGQKSPAEIEEARSFTLQ